MIEARIIEDSISPSGVRLTTFSLKYPRFIHAEFMTHRVFSRSASSSRAIPVKKMIDMVDNDWAAPVTFHKNTRGMQGKEVLDTVDQQEAYFYWHVAKKHAVRYAQKLADLGVHKQQVNRILEPFMHINVVCTATDYDNFFALRHHHMAQPEIEVLAKRMYEAYVDSKPTELKAGEWHLPYVLEGDNLEDMIKESVAKCARVSYLNHEGKEPTKEENERLYERLLGSQPIHATPAEHQAMAVADPNVRSGNFRGWIQYRKTLEGENVTKFKPGMFG